MSKSHPTPFRNPHNLPVKVCAGCGRPFTWRKKWNKDWAQVKYCSEKCRKAASGTLKAA